MTIIAILDSHYVGDDEPLCRYLGQPRDVRHIEGAQRELIRRGWRGGSDPHEATWTLRGEAEVYTLLRASERAWEKSLMGGGGVPEGRLTQVQGLR